MKKIIFSTLVFSCLNIFSQQDAQYSLYQFNQLVINPAYAGARDGIAAVIDARKQWVGFAGSPTTAAFSIHSAVLNKKLGVGINALSDQIGAKKVTGVYANVSYILKLNNKFKLSFGVRAGYSNYKFDFKNVSYKDQANETALTDLANTNRGTFDMDAGIYLKSNTFYVGVSATHLNNGVLYKNSFKMMNTAGNINDYTLNYSLMPHLFLTVGKTFVVSESFLISPSVMVKYSQYSPSVDVNLNFFLIKKLWLGAFYRSDYGVGALFQVYVTKQLRIGYSFDTGLGPRHVLGGSHELMLGFDFGQEKAKAVSPRFL